MTDIAVSFAAILPMLLVSLFADRLASITRPWRRRLGSFAGGLAAAYVFLLVLPKLAGQQIVLQQATSGWPLLDYFYHHAYFVALVGFVTSYFVNVLAEGIDTSVPRSASGVVLVVGLVAYCVLIGDQIAALDPQPLSLALFSTALTFHVLGLNLAVYGHLSRSWNWLRVLLATSLFLGWLTGLTAPIPVTIHALVSAWLAGGIIILVVLIELPKDRRPVAFVAGAFTFTLLLKLHLHLSGVEGGV